MLTQTAILYQNVDLQCLFRLHKIKPFERFLKIGLIMSTCIGSQRTKHYGTDMHFVNSFRPTNIFSRSYISWEL